MSRFLSLGLGGILFFGAEVSAQSFEGFDSFAIQPIEGSVQVYCRRGGERDQAFFRCSAAFASPFGTAYLTVPSVDADRYEVIAVRADGTQKRVSGRFLAEEGRSESRINLLLDSVLNRSLLRLGENKILYRLLREGRVVREGEFVAPVEQERTQVCRYSSMNSFDMNDCRFQSRACDRYFRQQNYCRN